MEIVKSDAKKNANNPFARLVMVTARSRSLSGSRGDGSMLLWDVFLYG